MNKTNQWAWRWASLGAMTLLAVGGLTLSGCGGGDEEPTILNGQSGSVFGGTVNTWAVTDDAGAVTEVGFTLPLASIQNAAGESMAPAAVLQLPPQVKSSTFIDHLEISWNEHGHPPAGVYEVPHFDIHFYNQTAEQVMGIDCSDKTDPAANRIPTGYALPPAAAPGACVPMMGYHGSPATDFAPGFSFTHSMIMGYYGGRLTFVEPMITRDLLLRRQSFVMDIPTPQTVGQSTRLPTKFNAEWDQQAQAYRFTLSGFVPVS